MSDSAARTEGTVSELVAFASHVASEQYTVAKALYDDPRTSAPLFVIWVASFGGSLHAPVTTFFLLEVGATQMDVGWLGFMQATGTLVCAPMYGWLLDNKSPFLAMALSAFMCSAGCLIRGFATNVSMLYFGMGMLGVSCHCHCPALPCHCTATALPLHCTALPCPALPCPALHCTALPCPALPCTAVVYVVCVLAPLARVCRCNNRPSLQ